MGRRLAALVGAVALAAALSIPTSAAAGRVSALVSGPITLVQIDRNVEPWVLFGQAVWNPTQCAWDPDDHASSVGEGYLDPGASVTYSGCFIANADPLFGGSWAIHPRWHLDVQSAKEVSVTACEQPSGWCSGPLVASGAFVYDLCTDGPFYDPSDPLVGPIAGSNGGSGVMSSIVFTITNASPRRISPIWVTTNGGNDQDNCLGVPMTLVPGVGSEFYRQG